jgi:diaminopimelate decarboxylase
MPRNGPTRTNNLPHPVRYRSNVLELMGHSLARLAHENGTPTYVYSLKRIKAKIEGLRAAFGGASPINIFYAMKANANREILGFLSGLDIGVDVVSGGEIKRALECGFRGPSIIYSGVGKRIEEIELGLRNSVSCFNVESVSELRRILDVSRRSKAKATVSLRIKPDIDPMTHRFVSTGRTDNKFGLDVSALGEVVEVLQKGKKHLHLSGVDFHIGSQLTRLGPFVRAIKRVAPVYRRLQQLGFPLVHFNVGGGIGIPYEEVDADGIDAGVSIDISEYAKQVSKLLNPLQCQIYCEPGRYLVGDAGILLTKVQYLKHNPGKSFVVVDSGMHHLLRPALYGAYHRILPVRRRIAGLTAQAAKSRQGSKKGNKKGKSFVADVVGPICESSDYLGVDRRFNDLKEGDLLAVTDAGAYGYVMASDYNLHPRPKEIVI